VHSLKSKTAFTLLEILVVLVILVFIFQIASRRLFAKDTKINNTFKDLIHLNRRLAVSSKLHRKVYRLVFNLQSNKVDEFWVEKQERDPKKGLQFVLDENFFKNPQKIHSLLKIQSIESLLWEESKTSGPVYIYYYPKGLFQELALQFLRSDNQGRWTLYLNPISKEFQLLKPPQTLEGIKNL